MRISSAILLALSLGGCGQSSAPTAEGAQDSSKPVARADQSGGGIACAHGSDAMTPGCSVDMASTAQGLELTLRHPDGAFRRLLVTADGRGVVAADGAEQAVVKPAGSDRIEVAIGSDRYLLPATVGVSLHKR